MAKKKLESNFINMVLILFLVCLASSFSLGTVYNLTKDRIDAAKEAKKLKKERKKNRFRAPFEWS